MKSTYSQKKYMKTTKNKKMNCLHGCSNNAYLAGQWRGQSLQLMISQFLPQIPQYPCTTNITPYSSQFSQNKYFWHTNKTNTHKMKPRVAVFAANPLFNLICEIHTRLLANTSIVLSLRPGALLTCLSFFFAVFHLL